MNGDSPNRHWFAINVRSNCERMVATILDNKGYETLLPTYEERRVWSDRVKQLVVPLFPGYVFCRFDPSRRTAPIVTTPGVIRILGFGGRAIPVDDGEMESVRIVAASALSVEPWPYMRTGSPIRIVCGSLEGAEGVLLEVKNRRQLIVSITLLQRSVAVQIDKTWVAPLDALNIHTGGLPPHRGVPAGSSQEGSLTSSVGRVSHHGST